MKAVIQSLFLLFGLCSLAGAQPIVASVQRYGPEQGLAHREVNAIFQDRRDFMWFGTKFGLNRFDGATFTTYTREKNGLDFDDIHSIAQDADGLLWLMGPEGKSAITLFDPVTGVATSFEKRFNQPRPAHSPILPPIRLIGKDGTIFFIDYQPAKLNIYHPRSGLKTVSLPRYRTLLLAAVSSRNTVWAIANGNQLVELTPDGRVLQTFNHPTTIYICLGQRHDGTEFFYSTAPDAQHPDAGRLYKIDGAGHRQDQSNDLIKPKKMQRRLVYSFDRSGLVWNGYQLRDTANSMALDISDQLASGLIDDRSFFRDKNGGLWLGTSFGLYQIRISQNYFQRLFYQSGNGKQPAVRGINAVGDTLYTNLENNIGLFASRRSGASARQLFASPRSFRSLSGRVGRKLYLGEENTLVAYDYRTTKTSVIPLPGPGAVWTIHPFSANPHQLLAGGDPGLWLVDPDSNRVTPFRGYNQFPELAQAHVLHIGADRQGTLWICATTGLYTIDPKKGVTARYWRGGSGPFRLPADSYQHFYQDAGGLFWLATANAGLVRWDHARGRSPRQFKRADGLNNDNIYAVYADRRGHLWLSSDNGIMQFDPVRLTTRAYTVQDGITHNEFNRIAHYQDAQGRLYFGGLNGVTAFDPRDFEAEPPLPALPLRVVSFRQFEADRDTLVDKTEDLLRTGQITLQPTDRSSILDFALLNYTDAQKNTYAYQFKGVDNTWRYQTESSLRLGNLPYGDHELLIRGQAADGRLSSSTLSIGVRVLRPFYLRGWFAFFLVFLVLGGAWAWGRWRERQYQKAQIRLQTQINEATRIIARQAQDLQQLDETKSRFFANISHEFRTPLTIILGMADNLHRQADPGLQQTARLIERSGRNLLRLINQMLDLSRLEAGEMPLQLVRSDLIHFIHYVGETFQSMACTKGVELAIHTEEASCEADFNPEKLQDIVGNLLANALRFTPAGGAIRCGVTIQPTWQPLAATGYHEALVPTQGLDGPWIQITVSDTGPGIDPASLTRIFNRFYQAGPPQAGPHQDDVVQPVSGGTGIGLSLVRELVGLMQGGLAVRNRSGLERSGLTRPGLEGPGAEFVVHLPLTRQAPLASDVLPTSIMAAPDPFESADWVEPAPEVVPDRPVLLLVEDNDDVAAYIQSCLREEYQIIRAENGQIGIDQALSITPDLILSDVMMPVKDGFELCDTLKRDERTSHIPVVLLTARAAVDDRLTGLRRGADAYLVKPFQREELLLVLSNLLQTRRLLQHYYSQLALGSTQPDPLPRDGVDAREDEFVARLRNTLALHLDNTALDGEMICQLMGMSRNSLYRKVMALTGMSIIPYLRALRLQRAEVLLLNSTMSVAEVAYAVGFDNPRYFSRIFSEEKGASPSHFRNLG